MKKLVALVLLLCMVCSCGIAELTQPGEYPISTEKVELNVWVTQLGTVEDIPTNYEVVTVEEKTNVHVNWTIANSSEVSEKFNTSMANNNRCDVYLNWLGTDETLMYAEDGVLIPLEDLIDQYAPNIAKALEDNPGVREQITAPDGHIYELPNLIYNVQESIPKMWVYKEWLEAYKTATGKGTPATTEEFKDMLIYFRDNDMNGNGDNTDEIPLTGNYQYWKEGADPHIFLMNAFTLCPANNPLPYMLADDDGNVTCVALSDDFREGLQYINDLYKEKLLVEETYVQDLFQFRQLTSVPKTNVTVGAAAAPYPYRLLTYNADPAYVTFTDYECIEPLTGPKGVKGCYASQDNIINLRTFITSSCKDPVLAIRWLDYFYSEEGRSWSNFYGQEGKHWVWSDEPSFGGGDKSVKVIWQYGSTQNEYLPQGWGPNTYRTLEDYNSKAASDAATDSQLLAINAHRVYAPFATVTKFPQISWCTDQDLIDERAELNTAVGDAMIAAVTEFIIGKRDINDDAAWEAYKTEMENLGLSRLLELHEAYYFGK